MIAGDKTPARSIVLFHNRAVPANPPLERPCCSLYVRMRFRVKHYSADAAGEWRAMAEADAWNSD